MRPRVRALLAFLVIVAVAIAGAAYLFERGTSILARLFRWSGPSPRVTVADLTSGPMDLVAFGCGVERWAVKTLSDDDAARVVEAEPKEVTIRQLLELPPPRWSRDAPRFPNEVQYIVEGEISAYKLEPDGDIHLIIGSDHVNMVAELPSPACVPRVAARPVLDAARHNLLAILQAVPDSTAREPPQPIPVRIRAVLFWDKSHGQIGGTWNGAELHPVLEISRR
jgi:hypothetical protein